MIHKQQSKTMIVVVDPDRAGYGAIAAVAANDDTDVHFLASGQAALRLHPIAGAGLWLINVELPDMTGFDLYEMLRERLDEGTVVCMVAATYGVEEELRACRAGATMYVCKPLEASWLQKWLGPIGDRPAPAALPGHDNGVSLPWPHLECGEIRGSIERSIVVTSFCQPSDSKETKL